MFRIERLRPVFDNQTAQREFLTTYVQTKFQWEVEEYIQPILNFNAPLGTRIRVGESDKSKNADEPLVVSSRSLFLELPSSFLAKPTFSALPDQYHPEEKEENFLWKTELYRGIERSGKLVYRLA